MNMSNIVNVLLYARICLMMRLLSFVDVRSQLLLLFAKGLLLLPLHGQTAQHHHYWLVPSLLSVRRATRLRLILLALL